MISGQKDYHVVTSLGPGNAPEPATSITPPGDHALCRNLVLSIHIALIINQLRISLFVVDVSSFYEDMHWQICKISKGAQFSPSNQSHESSMPLRSAYVPCKLLFSYKMTENINLEAQKAITLMAYFIHDFEQDDYDF